MQYTATYQSPIGGILLAADDIGLTGLWFEGGKYYAEGLGLEHEEKWLPVFDTAKNGWTFIFPTGNRILCRLCI